MEQLEVGEGNSDEVLVPVPLLLVFLLREAQGGHGKGEGSQEGREEGSQEGREERREERVTFADPSSNDEESKWFHASKCSFLYAQATRPPSFLQFHMLIYFWRCVM